MLKNTGKSLVASLLALILLLAAGTAFAITITNVNPSSGVGGGGENITITGTGFAPTATVKIGSSAASSTVASSTVILVTTPAGAGAEDVIVNNGDGTYATSTNAFTYPDLAVLTNIAITTPANKLTYHTGDTLDLTGLVVTGTFSNGSASTIPITASNVTGFSSAAAALGQTLKITSGSASTTYSIDILPAPLTLTTSANSDGSISGTVSGVANASTVANGVSVMLDIPAGTVVTASSSWDGKITLPSATTSYVLTPNSGKTATVVAAIEIGAGDIPLSLSDPAKITFTGQAGKLAGWSQGGVFNPITTTCDSTSTTPTLATSTSSGPKDCKIDIGSDLVIWTTHLTTFIAYTESSAAISPSPTPSPAPIQSGGGPIGIFGYPTQPQAAPAPTPTPTPTPPIGQVLGASTYNFVTTLTIGSTGEAVTALQNILTEQGFFSGPITGYFGRITQAAVKAFQSANGISPIGIVGPQTRAALNGLNSNGGMTDSARQTLIAILMQKLQQLYAQIAALTGSSTTATSTSTTSTSTSMASTSMTTTTASTSSMTATSTAGSTTSL